MRVGSRTCGRTKTYRRNIPFENILERNGILDAIKDPSKRILKGRYVDTCVELSDLILATYTQMPNSKNTGDIRTGLSHSIVNLNSHSQLF